ncbi:hypothetical protein FKR81_17950 [Lentzea tibetensis]|uniref:WD40-like Beta Propeller Repeat n=1 Tax=Lentzea tibetensis TaxID=2591470 RepID=A0A563ETU7_9PSEU|nr:PD40 domain-containing protein [Lentzea tibetensis]TWP50958.1 hypothetical protein FKR81_17950 [Lentzea tibetensis]
MNRVAVGVAALVAVVLFGAGYVVWTINRPTATASSGGASGTGLRFVDQSDGRNRVDELAPDGTRTAGSLRCQRVYAAAGTTVCLRLAGLGPSYEVAVLGGSGEVLKTVGLPGVPSRARVSASGKIVSWTVFVVGDSYAVPGGFSTRTGYLDLRTGTVVESLEHYTAYIDGTPTKRDNFNFWGMTFADDDQTFYATLGSGTQTWLVKGDITRGEVRTLRANAECPSLSPDGKRVAYKKRAGTLGAWQLFVLDLESGEETPLPGSNGLDDQAAWLDGSTLAYAKVPQGQAPAIYASAADGSGEPRLLVSSASSPSPR